MPISEYQLTVAAPIERLWAFHELPDAVQRLSPPGSGIRVLRHDSPLREGGETLFSMPFLPFARICWLAHIAQVHPPHGFTDEQVEGPMAAWRHEHRLHALGPNQSQLTDHITWRLPLWQLPPLSHFLIRRRLNALFEHRHAVIRQWCEASSEQKPQ